MNNKGMSLIELIGVIIVIGVIATIAVPGVSKFINKGSLTTYLTYEKSMEDAATNAVLDCIGNNSPKCEVQAKGENRDIKLSTLIEDGFLDPMKDEKIEKCDSDKSFVRVEYRGNLNYKFDVCLYCDGYQTDSDMCSVEE